jgi:hypothetical protein
MPTKVTPIGETFSHWLYTRLVFRGLELWGSRHDS